MSILLGNSTQYSILTHTNCVTVLKTKTQIDSRFSAIGYANRIFAISAIHGEVEKLAFLHDNIYEHISPGDRVIYTGNYIGYGPNSAYVIDEILAFRRAVLAKRSMIPSDIIYLRGAQEEMWQKLLQLQFAPDPTKTFTWMLGNGLAATLGAYGLCQHDGIEACRQGIVGLSKWTAHIRDRLNNHAGHQTFTTQLVRAAYSPEDAQYPMLFVHSGIDTQKPLDEQGDSFWWAHDRFDQITEPYLPFEKVIRGYDPTHKGPSYNCVKATIDGGCGFGGDLACTAFASNGNIIDTLLC